MKYPKLAAALDEELSAFVRENGIEGLFALVMSLKPEPVVAEKSVPIPVSTGEEAKL